MIATWPIAVCSLTQQSSDVISPRTTSITFYRVNRKFIGHPLYSGDALGINGLRKLLLADREREEERDRGKMKREGTNVKMKIILACFKGWRL